MTPEKYDYTAKTGAVGGGVRRLNKLPGFCSVDAKKYAVQPAVCCKFTFYRVRFDALNHALVFPLLNYAFQRGFVCHPVHLRISVTAVDI